MPAKSNSSSEQIVDIDPLLIYFTFSRIRPRFSCGRTIESTIQQFRNGELQPRDLPLLSVLTDGTHYFSQNNRRLYTYKLLKHEGLLDVVPVRLRPFPQTKRMHSKYTPETCSLTATLMRDVEKNGTAAPSKAASKIAMAAAEEELDGDAEERSDNGEGGEAMGGQVQNNSTENVRAQKAASASLMQAPMHANATNADTEERSTDSDEASGVGKGEKTLSRKQKKICQKTRQQQQRREPKGRRKNESDSDGGDESGGVSSLEAELRKLGLQ